MLGKIHENLAAMNDGKAPPRGRIYEWSVEKMCQVQFRKHARYNSQFTLAPTDETVSALLPENERCLVSLDLPGQDRRLHLSEERVVFAAGPKVTSMAFNQIRECYWMNREVSIKGFEGATYEAITEAKGRYGEDVSLVDREGNELVLPRLGGHYLLLLQFFEWCAKRNRYNESKSLSV